MVVPSVITSQTRKRRRGFNLGRSVSHGQSGPCACQRLGEGSVNHGARPASPGLQLWLFERSVNWNTVHVREKVNDFVGGPCEDSGQVLRHLHTVQKTISNPLRLEHLGWKLWNLSYNWENVFIILKIYWFCNMKPSIWSFLHSIFLPIGTVESGILVSTTATDSQYMCVSQCISISPIKHCLLFVLFTPYHSQINGNGAHCHHCFHL